MSFDSSFDSSFEMWTHEFCLACDRQTDGAAYCSESCKLAEFEKTSAPSSTATSPSLEPSEHWSTRQTKLYLSPAYDFSVNAHRNATRSNPNTPTEMLTQLPPRLLTPSSSHSSLCSIQSTSTASPTDSKQLSDNAKRELQSYAISFEQARLQRRRSY